MLFTYLALSATPFLPLLLGRPVENPGRMLVTECAAWLAVWTVFRRPARFHWLLLPAFLASMMYVSDHGQTLNDGSCKLTFHGHNTQYDFHVPALVWYSDLYLTHPAKVAQLRRNMRARLATENVFHSLLDMADIRYGSEQLEWSFVNRKFIQHKRYVDSYGWADYDNAAFRGDCREVIDRGTPLARK